MKNTTISISTDVKEQLSSLGSKGETYNEVIEKLLTAAEKSAFFERQKSILNAEEFMDLDEI